MASFTRSFTGAGFGESGFGTGSYGSAGTQPLETLPIQYYLGLISSEHQSSPAFMAMTYALLSPIFDLIALLTQMDDKFDLDQAVGVQLDMLGVIVGVSRTVSFVPSNGVSPILDDPTYRLLLKARIAWNQFSGNLAGIQALWANLFPSGTIIVDDLQSMAATILLTGSFTSIIVDLIDHGWLVPRPQGVLYNYVIPVLPIFGCDLSTSYQAGVDLGHLT
jgi:Protein of unknown function (DUF2612)